MDREKIRQDLEEVFAAAFGDDSIRISDRTTAGDVPGWDSLSHIGLILRVEKQFQVYFTVEEVMNLENVGQMIGLLQAKLNAGST